MSWIIPFDKAKPTPEARRFNRWMYTHPWRFYIEARRLAWGLVSEKALTRFWARFRKEERSL